METVRWKVGGLALYDGLFFTFFPGLFYKIMLLGNNGDNISLQVVPQFFTDKFYQFKSKGLIFETNFTYFASNEAILSTLFLSFMCIPFRNISVCGRLFLVCVYNGCLCVPTLSITKHFGYCSMSGALIIHHFKKFHYNFLC